MELLTLSQTHRSQVDKTRKLIYTLFREEARVQDEIDYRQHTIEVGVIDKSDGKDILCVPTQTNCAQACRFCHTTQMAGKVAVTNLSADEIAEIVRTAWLDSGLVESEQPLLVSFMGAGEPMANSDNLIAAMLKLWAWSIQMRVKLRFGLATMLPERHLIDFESFTKAVRSLKLPVKVHLSLHYAKTAQRREWMPASASVGDSLLALENYRADTKNPVEIHYTLIEGVNDSREDITRVAALIGWRGIPVKFLRLNPLPGDTHKPPSDEWVAGLREILSSYGVETEYYASPGADIAASCGMFMTEAYIKTSTPFVQIDAAAVTQPQSAFSKAMRLHDHVAGVGVRGVREALSEMLSEEEQGYGFGVLDEAQCIAVAKNVKIGGCTTGFAVPASVASSIAAYAAAADEARQQIAEKLAVPPASLGLES